MSIQESTGAFERARHALRYSLLAAVLSCALVAVMPSTAHAEGGVNFVGAVGAGLEAVSPKPSVAYTLALEFDKNVGYANPGEDATFVEENVQKVHLLDS